MDSKLLEQAKKVLTNNDRGDWTVPAADLYPHQWLWDSCFIAMGLRHLDLERAQSELKNLLRGQWANGMLPHILFLDENSHGWQQKHEEAWINPHAPNGLITSGITQPPMLAEAVWQIGQKMKLPERRAWYKTMLPRLIDYHAWIYKERVREGLAILIHPYESGMDSSPPILQEVRQYAWPRWLRVARKLKLDGLARVVRRDTRHAPGGQRVSNIDGIADWALMRQLRAKAYDGPAILAKPRFAIQDLGFNCIFIRANAHLEQIAKTAGLALPSSLLENMERTREAIEDLWDEASGQYYSRSLLSGQLIKEPTLSTLLPLYAGSVSKERAEHLVSLLKKRSLFKTNWPVPSVPTTSTYFEPLRYWQGPTWINTNWLIIDGLKRYGFNEEANELKQKTLELVAKNGCWEYFSPLDGLPAGAANFSWTAALAIDLLKS